MPSQAGAARLTPTSFAALAAAAYLLLTLPILFLGSRDLSFFVIAGDFFVDPHALLARIYVRPGSYGYDGQFFYRLAVAPFSLADTAGGIRFDVPVYRSQRFLYPLLAWVVSAGQPGAAAAALFAINLAGIGGIAAAALSLVRRLALPDATAWAIVAWPGLLVTLTHDTAEIVAVAFLLSAMAVRDRLPLYILLGAAATLARETTAPVFAGLFLYDALALRRGGSWRLLLADGLAVVPLLAVHAVMPILWHQTTSEGVLAHDFGWPLLGLGRALVEKVTELTASVSGHNRRSLAALNLGALVLLLAARGHCLDRGSVASVGAADGRAPRGRRRVRDAVRILPRLQRVLAPKLPHHRRRQPGPPRPHRARRRDGGERDRVHLCRIRRRAVLEQRPTINPAQEFALLFGAIGQHICH